MLEHKREDTGRSLEAAKMSVKVIGVGGAGANVLDRIALEGMDGAELISMNTDIRALNTSVANSKIQLGRTLTQGLAAGGDPELGLQAAQEAEPEIRAALQNTGMVFICCGLGGGTSSGAAPFIARIAREEGAFVVGFVTVPFKFEGRRRMDQAMGSLGQLEGVCNALVTFDNDRMGDLVLPKEGIQQAFAAADQIISQSVRAVTTLVTQPGLIRIGMDELLTALRNRNSRCLFGYGQAKGENRAQEALSRALKSPLLDKGTLLKHAANAIVQVSGGESMTLYEVEILMTEVEKHVHEDAQILFGVSADDKGSENISVTIISSVSEPFIKPNGGDPGNGSAANTPQPIAQAAPVAAATQPAAAAVVASPPPKKPEAPVQVESERKPVAVPTPVATDVAVEPAPVATAPPEVVVAEPEPEKFVLPPELDSSPAPVNQEEADEEADEESDVESEPEPVLIDDEPSLFVDTAPVESVPLVKIRVPAKASAPAPEPEIDVEELVEAEPFVELESLEEVAPLSAPTPKLRSKTASSPKEEIKSTKAAPALEPAPREVKQEELIPKKPATRGRFEKSEPTVIDGEDLDVPTFLRKKP
jgi:cell division protein FtsZ